MFSLLFLLTLSGGLHAVPSAAAEPAEPLFSVGVVTDVHYSDDRPTANNRYYGASKRKLEEALTGFNAAGVDLVISLGDLIDGDPQGYAAIAPVLESSRAPVLKIAGNHDFPVPCDEQKRDAAFRTMGFGQHYFSYVRDGYRLLFLDGNDVSVYAHPIGSSQHAEAVRMLAALTDDGAANARDYNGAMGQEQLEWLARELDAASAAGEQVVCFCHMPVLPLLGRYTLWNNLEVVALLAKYPCVKAFLAGHHHAGGYGVFRKVHHVTFRGMIEGPENHFAILDVYRDRLGIRGFGAEESRILRYLE